MAISIEGRKLRAEIMYKKGGEFLKAAVLLKKSSENNELSYVQIYLLLQGIEIKCKGLLLINDPRLNLENDIKKRYRHNIQKLIKAVCKAYNVSLLDKELSILVAKLTPKNIHWISY